MPNDGEIIFADGMTLTFPETPDSSCKEKSEYYAIRTIASGGSCRMSDELKPLHYYHDDDDDNECDEDDNYYDDYGG